MEVRIRARASYAARLHELERVIDGTSVQTVTAKDELGRTRVTTVTPNAKEKVLALQELGKLAKIHEDDSNGVAATEEQLAKLLVTAFSDPAVRTWILSQHPDAVEAMRLQLVGESPEGTGEASETHTSPEGEPESVSPSVPEGDHDISNDVVDAS
jgi:hypothetical protein